MSKITTLFVIFACLTTAFALNATLTKNYFFVNTINQLSYKLFHTTNGIIAYNLEYGVNAPIPQYLLLDPTQRYATPILEDLLISCGQVGSVVFDRLGYNVQTSTLAYFCTANNSLLILDQKTYAVQESIPTGISANFSEAKPTSDGSSLYVLLMGTRFEEDQIPSQLVQFDLSTKKVIRSVVFDQGLTTNEYVYDFVSQNNESFALTTVVNIMTGDTTLSIYSIAFTGNSSQLLQIATFPNEGIQGFLNLLYQVGDYLVTNNLRGLVFLDKQGNTVSTYNTIGSKTSYATTVSSVPPIVAVEGSSDLYVLFLNMTLYKLTAENGTIVPTMIEYVFDFQIAYGNQDTNDLLFIIDTYQSNFIITDLQNSELVYSVPSTYDDFVITNSTFGILQNGLLQVFNRGTNAPIGNITISTPLFLHTDNDTLYFSEIGTGGVSCVIKRLNLITLSTAEVQSYPNSGLCSDLIWQFKITDNGYPEFVARDQSFNMVSVVTETHGIAQFGLSLSSGGVEYIVADYDTLSLYQLQSNYSANSATVDYYEYNANSFDLKNSYNISGAAVFSYYASDSDKAYAFSKGSFKTIDLESGSTTEYSFPTFVRAVSSFKDNTGNEHLIFSDLRDDGMWGGVTTLPSLFDSNGVSQLPGTNNFTVQAGAAGPCSYWMVDGFITSVGLVKFYNVCGQQDDSIFSILQ